MPVKFDDHYLRPVEPRFMVPGLHPGDQSGKQYYEMGARYPMDQAAIDLFDAVARKGFDLPDIDVKFDTYGPSSNPFMVLRSISGGKPGHKWEIRYGRPMYTDGNRWNIVTGLSEMKFNRQELSIHSDGSGPSYERYAGKDWMADEERFQHGIKCNSKLRGEEKWYLKYRRKGDAMVVDNDLGREYEAEPRALGGVFHDAMDPELPIIPLHAIFDEANKFLQKLTKEISANYPNMPGDPLDRLKQMAYIERIPVPKGTPPLVVAQDSSNQSDSVAVTRGRRLCALSIPNDPENPFPERAYDGFAYGFDRAPYRSEINWFNETSGFGWRDKTMLVCLKYANDIFVVDQKAYLDARRIMWEKVDAEIPPRDRLTDAEADSFRAALATTMVPLTEYSGGYEQPMYLIGRPLGWDEAGDMTDHLKPKSKRGKTPPQNFEERNAKIGMVLDSLTP